MSGQAKRRFDEDVVAARVIHAIEDCVSAKIIATGQIAHIYLSRADYLDVMMQVAASYDVEIEPKSAPSDSEMTKLVTVGDLCTLTHRLLQGSSA